jgi:hypothetical protein
MHDVRTVAAGAASWLRDLAQTSWGTPPVPAWLVVAAGALAVLACLVSYRLGLRRGRGLIRKLLTSSPWRARGVVSDGPFTLDGEQQRVLDALGGEEVLAASSVAALTNLAFGSVRDLAVELEAGGYVAIGRFRPGADWQLQLTPDGRMALRAVRRVGRRGTTTEVQGPAARPLPSPRVPSPAPRPGRSAGHADRPGG